MATRWKAAGLLIAVGLAVLGVWQYARSPGTVTYQASGLLTAPLLLIVAVWLHLRLASWLQWALAIVLAVIGPVGYLVQGGDQWWNWGQVAVLPLILLAFASADLDGDDDDDVAQAGYGGGTAGPWGPP